MDEDITMHRCRANFASRLLQICGPLYKGKLLKLLVLLTLAALISYFFFLNQAVLLPPDRSFHKMDSSTNEQISKKFGSQLEKMFREHHKMQQRLYPSKHENLTVVHHKFHYHPRIPVGSAQQKPDDQVLPPGYVKKPTQTKISNPKTENSKEILSMNEAKKSVESRPVETNSSMFHDHQESQPISALKKQSHGNFGSNSVLNPRNVPRHYYHDKEAFKKYVSYLGRKTEDIVPEQDRAVIILTNHRSGSSFFGELFNQHPDVFYFFEPLFPLSNSSQCSINTELKTAVVSQLIQCQMPNWMEIYSKLSPANRQPATMNLNICLNKKMCFRCKTKEMTEEKHCPTSKFSRNNCGADCGVVNPTLVANDCRRKSMVAMKLIRLCDILELEKVVKSSAVDVKILHLLRDPRGIANSRRGVMRGLNIIKSIKMTCGRQSHNVNSALLGNLEWLKGRYKLLRYEDIATSPYEVAQSVYDFVGLNFPDSVADWIAANTNIENSADASDDATADSTSTKGTTPGVVQRLRRDVSPDITGKRIYPQLPPKLKLPAGRNPYGTKRDSIATVQKWVWRLPYSIVQNIEYICQDIMEKAGYNTVGSQEDYMRNRDMKYFTNEIPIIENMESA